VYNVIAYGLDYVRYKVFSNRDVVYIGKKIPYIEIQDRYFHGVRFVDLAGKQLEIIRMLEDVNACVLSLAEVYPVHRVDVFVDVEGDVLDAVTSDGTVIMNAGRVETIYSHHLKRRGNVSVFARAYDAQAAGHYGVSTTRLEVEFKKASARGLLKAGKWLVNPIGAMLHSIKMLLGVSIQIDDIEGVEIDAPRRKYEHSRERFYMRYGQSIARDIESMGVQGLYDFIVKCIRQKEKSDAKGG